ncbi:hypothetical protein KC887_03760 [Candidatus Kaiserbacteria bacterium]|nr:hypothetical protein [Candidatus Kaiserbacteria bacterium]
MKSTQKRTIVIGAIILALVSAAFYFAVVKPHQDNQIVAAVVNETIVNNQVGLRFSYPSGMDGLSIIEPPVQEDGLLRAAYILMPTQSYISFQSTSTPEGTEAPAAISIFAFAAPKPIYGDNEPTYEERLRTWATQNDALTSITLATNEPAIEKIDGLDLLTYTTDGLYTQKIYLGIYDKYAFMFVGQSDGDNTALTQQFADLMQTVTFE